MLCRLELAVYNAIHNQTWEPMEMTPELTTSGAETIFSPSQWSAASYHLYSAPSTDSHFSPQLL
jgi:hypothetical protein